jgi:hypothetical protein
MGSLTKLMKAMTDYPIEEPAAVPAVRGISGHIGVLAYRLAIGYNVVRYYHYDLLVILLDMDYLSLTAFICFPLMKTLAFCRVPLDYNTSLWATNGIERMRTITDRQVPRTLVTIAWRATKPMVVWPGSMA